MGDWVMLPRLAALYSEYSGWMHILNILDGCMAKLLMVHDPRGYPDVAEGESWAFASHRSMAEVIAEEATAA